MNVHCIIEAVCMCARASGLSLFHSFCLRVGFPYWQGFSGPPVHMKSPRGKVSVSVCVCAPGAREHDHKCMYAHVCHSVS